VPLVLLLAVTTAFFDRINIAVLFDNRDFQDAIGIHDPARLGLLMSAFVFAYGASALALSFLGDFLGPRRTLAAIAALLAVLMAVMGASSSFAVMLVARACLGLAEGPQFGTANAAVKRTFPPREHASANAVWTIGSPLGSAIGFPLVIFLVVHYGWRASFFALAVLNGFVVLPAVWLLMRGRAERAPSDGAPRAFFRQGLATFLRKRHFWFLTAYDCAALIYLWGFNSWLPSYLRQARHFDVLHTGFYASLPFFMMVAGELLGAWLGDATGRRALICFVGMILVGVFIFAAAVVPGAVLSAWCLALSAFFWGATTPTLFAIGMEIVPTDVTSAGFGVYAGISNIVGSAAPYIMGVLIGSTGNYVAGWEFLVVSCIALSFFMVPLLREH
jgi:predicted MFS family arabinose efflux permease